MRVLEIQRERGVPYETALAGMRGFFSLSSPNPGPVSVTRNMTRALLLSFRWNNKKSSFKPGLRLLVWRPDPRLWRRRRRPSVLSMLGLIVQIAHNGCRALREYYVGIRPCPAHSFVQTIILCVRGVYGPPPPSARGDARCRY